MQADIKTIRCASYVVCKPADLLICRPQQEVKMNCCFSTDISDKLSCSQDGEFDDYGFPISKCPQFPCAKYKELRQKIGEDRQANIQQPQPKSTAGQVEMEL